ncbi:hypothetical protein MAA_01583 [Metarhizium robertsii ARSEF 23]|nr:uncharacterized protein MAA_01583 [Metarhizium robertsii ARSEF 23]EFZ04509.1 hypothetical protein MAA_01583 [Metarhizium robertsii ARSEF 23]
MIQVSPAGQQFRRTLGPNWAAGLDSLQNLSPVPSPQNSVDPTKFEAFISMRIQKITEDWVKLQKDVGCRASFRKRWRQLTREARKDWLQMRSIPRDPHSHVYAWAQGLESGDQAISRSSFMSSLLNIEDLSDGSVLPDFLDARANTHPRLFRYTDSLSVLSGVYTGYLSLKCVPGMIVTFAPEITGVEEYGISLERGVAIDGEAYPLTLNEETPGMSLLQLEAQQRVYRFLADCLLVGLNDPSSESGNESLPCITGDEECPSLLPRAVRLDYYGRPGTIDLKYLGNLVNASLDEAREDLWQLRQDCGVWMNRLDETPGRMPGRTSNHLRVVFGRIDSFHTLSRHLLLLEKYNFFADQNHELDISGLSKDSEARGLLISLHVALVSVLEEQLCWLESVPWPKGTGNLSVLLQLLELLRTNNPALRILDMAAVMRVTDREIAKVDFGDSDTFLMMQALNDVSVLVCCLKESSKHSVLFSFLGEHIHLVNDLENKWEKQNRPWRSVMEKTLAALGETERHKLDRHIRNQSIDAKSRHLDFWQVINRYMVASSQGNIANEEVVYEIQQAAPVDMTRPVLNHAHAGWVGQANDESGITVTKLRRSKTRRDIQSKPLVLNPEQIAKARPLPVITPVRDIWFWSALSAPCSENKSELSWSDFETAMVNIGYKIHRHGGSGRRFEYGKEDASSCASNGTPGTIVFHEPHAKRGKVSHHLAKSWWLGRLQRRFELKL